MVFYYSFFSFSNNLCWSYSNCFVCISSQLVAPDFFGSPTTYNYWGVWNWAEFVSFIGIIPLALALLTILKKKPHAIFFIFLAVISIILALANPISKIPYLLKTPFLSSLQPSRILFLLVLQ